MPRSASSAGGRPGTKSAAILPKGWSDKVAVFTQYFGSEDLDVSSLMLSLTGFLPATDPRVMSTIEAIQIRLVDQRAWSTGTTPAENPTACRAERARSYCAHSGWLQALAMAGRPERAREVFERAISHRNDLDLLAEEIDSRTGEALGNFARHSAASAS